MSPITIPSSIFIEGQWFDAHWLAEVVDPATGELVITATTTTQARIIALRMTTDLVRDLRTQAGFATPAPTDAQDGQVERVPVWSFGVSRLLAALRDNYDPENDAHRVTYWDMQLADAVQRLVDVAERLDVEQAAMRPVVPAAAEAEPSTTDDLGAADYDPILADIVGEYRRRAERHEATLHEIAALTTVRPDGRWAWNTPTELFETARGLARKALDI